MTPPRSDSDTSQRRRVDEGACVEAAVLVAVVVFTAIVLARGVGGRLDRSLGGLAIWGIYLGMTLASGLASWRLLCRLERRHTDGTLFQPLGPILITSVCPLLTTLVLGRDFSAGMLTLLWLMTMAIAGVQFWLLARIVPTRQLPKPEGLMPLPASESQSAMSASRQMPATADSSPDSTEMSEPSASDEETFSQRWTRREGDIGDELEGILRIYFAVGQRTATADIPIVPAMASVPAVDCEPMHARDADVQVIVRGVHTYGVRLELQRPAHRDAAEEIEVAVLIHAEREERAD